MQCIWTLTIILGVGSVSATNTAAASNKNPIRPVVQLLERMQKKLMDEGKAEEELYEKYKCYCKKGSGDLTGTIGGANTKIPQVEKAIEDNENTMTQLSTDLQNHEANLEQLKKDNAKAKVMRGKEATAYEKEKNDYHANILALRAAIAAIEKGSYGSFLQTTASATLRRLTIDMDMSSMDREVLSSFLAQGHAEGYVPQSHQILGILKQMGDTMEKSLTETIATETEAIKNYEQLNKARNARIQINQKDLEFKTTRLGELRVENVNLKEDLDDTQKSLAADEKFLADLGKNCATKGEEWEARSKQRAAELLTVAETIKILNEDDALELFKKTLPSAMSLLQTVSSRQVKQQALLALGSSHNALSHRDPRLDFIALALRGHQQGFEKVIKMIDDMVAILAQEQTADDEKKALCERQVDTHEDNIKELEADIKENKQTIDGLNANIEDLNEGITSLTNTIASLDKQVAEATATRQAEHALFTENMADNTKAKAILEKAKNRMARYYTPNTYNKNAPSASLSEVSAHNFDAPPPPPETWDAYSKRPESTGVVALLTHLIDDLEKDITQISTDEKEGQAEYEQFMADSSAKRASDSQSKSDKEEKLADTQAELQKTTAELNANTKEAMAESETLRDVHLECDWLVENHATRKAARAGEVDSLKSAKAVLSGADYQ